MTDTPTPHPMDTAPQDGTEIVLHTPGAFCSYAVARWVPFKDGSGGWITDRSVTCRSCDSLNSLQVVDPAGWLTIGEALSAAPADDDAIEREIEGTAEGLARDLRRAYVVSSGNWQEVVRVAQAAVQSPPPADLHEAAVEYVDAQDCDVRDAGDGGDFGGYSGRKMVAAFLAGAMRVQSPPPIMGEGLVDRLTGLIRRMQERIEIEPRPEFGLHDVDILLDAAVALATPSTQEKDHGR